MSEISVIICTHNPLAKYLERTLASLQRQTLDVDRWELLVVDNLSDIPLVDRLDLSWHPMGRIVREEKLGLTPARLRGIREAVGETLVFVDDDNVLDPDYLEQARLIAAQRPWLGAWSGQCRGEFETQPPEWTRQYWGNLVIREFDRDTWSNLPRLPDTMPCGAGMAVRRDVAQYYLSLYEGGERTIQYDRTGGSLLSGGDNDLAGCACLIGLGVGLTRSLKLTHLISSGRLTQDYLSRLAYGIHYSSVLLDAEYGIVRLPRSPLGLVLDWLRRMRLHGPHRSILRAAQTGANDAALAIFLRKT